MGPCLVAGSEILDPSRLLLRTTVDGELRQEEGVEDLLFDCAYLLSYLSQGTTLQKGSVVMTGTPGGKSMNHLLLGKGIGHTDSIFSFCFVGVGAGLTPPKYLVPGTQMDVSIDKIGSLRNNVVFD